MKIALIAPDIPDYCIEFAEMASALGEVTLFAPAHRLAADRVRAGSALNVRRLDWPRQSNIIGSVAFVGELARAVRALEPDIVHVLAEGNAWMGLLAHRLGPVPLLTTVHDAQFHPGDTSSQRVPHIVRDILVKRSDALLVHGETMRAQAHTNGALRSKRLFAFPHVPLRAFHRLAAENGWQRPEDGAFRVLFFGRVFAYKGVEHLLAAADIVRGRNANVEFTIAGAGPDWERFKYRAESMRNVRALDRFIPTEEAARLFAEADLLVLPYIEASESGVLMMAMPFGLPVVASRVGQMAATVVAAGAGVVVPPADAPALADAILQLAADPARRSALAENASRAMVTMWSQEALSRDLLAIYTAVIEAVRRPRAAQNAL